jgi:hypothetical protein
MKLRILFILLLLIFFINQANAATIIASNEIQQQDIRSYKAPYGWAKYYEFTVPEYLEGSFRIKIHIYIGYRPNNGRLEIRKNNTQVLVYSNFGSWGFVNSDFSYDIKNKVLLPGDKIQLWVDGSTYYGFDFVRLSNFRMLYSFPVNITSYTNSKTNNNTLNLFVGPNEAITFSAVANQNLTIWRWFKDNVNQSGNYNSLTTNFSIGNHTIKVNGTNPNGTSQTITWTVYSSPIFAQPDLFITSEDIFFEKVVQP